MSKGELEQLRARLARAEEALRAIRSGELDALLVPGPEHQQQVFTLASAERPYRLMIQQMHEGAVTTSLESGAALYCNRSFARMIGLPAPQVVGRRLGDSFRATGMLSVAELFEASEARRGDFDLVTASGRTLPVSVSATSVLGEGAPTRCMIVADLSERLDNEHLRRVRAQLEQANRRKNEFIAMLGHELRNPLAPLRQAVEVLRGGQPATDDETWGRAVDVLERQLGHMSRLVDDLLDAGRITKGTLNVQPEPISLRELVEAALESTERLFARRRHRLDVEIPDGDVMLMADPVRVTQILANLLSNAAKYTPDGGHVELTASVEGEQIHVRVRDDGRGISDELLPQLFEPFVQGRSTLDRTAGGLGVGLTLVKRLAELHGGSVEARSEGLDRGSEFSVWLPLVSRAQANRRGDEAVSVDEDQRQRKILVVDDNEDAAEMMAMVLRKRGHEVMLAFDGPEALEMASAFEPDVVCLDIGLPGMDGFEVARRLRSGPTGDDLVLLAVTGYGQTEDRERADSVGFDALLVKPVAAEALEQAIEQAG
jgi:PAS domain S-box-containing protein